MGCVIGWRSGEGVGGQAEGTADRTRAAIAGGEDVNVGVADHDGFGRRNGTTGDGAGFCNETLEAMRVGFLSVEAVAAVVLKEEAR